MKKSIFFIILFLSNNLFADWSKVNFENSSYLIYLPKNLSSNTNVKNALMVNLHGCSQKPDDLKNDGNWSTTADDYNLIVVLPLVPNGGKYSGCWDYYGPDHSRSNRDNTFILHLVQSLKDKNELNIDPNQIYISGLSSGGGESLILGCLAPDIFTGMGINAGPAAGTTANEIGMGPSSLESSQKTCLKLATNSNNQDKFKTQLTSIIYGNNDYIVSTKHDTANAEILSNLYNAKTKSTFDTKNLVGTNNEGTGTLWSDSIGPRISLIMNANLGHNWPGGQGGSGGNFINKKSINYPLYLTKFFFENNKRAKSVFHPDIFVNNFIFADKQMVLNGKLNTNLRDLVEFKAKILNLKTNEIIREININVNKDYSFEAVTELNNDGEYDIVFEIKFLNGLVKTSKRNFWIGEIPNILSPQLFNVNFSNFSDCIKISGQAVNNGVDKITSVHIKIDNREAGEAFVENTFWNFKKCSINNGEHLLNVYALNESELKSNQTSIKFTSGISNVTSNLFDHMSAHRLSWEEYGIWYAKYQNQPFTLFLKANGKWSDEKN